MELRFKNSTEMRKRNAAMFELVGLWPYPQPSFLPSNQCLYVRFFIHGYRLWPGCVCFFFFVCFSKEHELVFKAVFCVSHKRAAGDNPSPMSSSVSFVTCLLLLISNNLCGFFFSETLAEDDLSAAKRRPAPIPVPSPGAAPDESSNSAPSSALTRPIRATLTSQEFREELELRRRELQLLRDQFEFDREKWHVENEAKARREQEEREERNKIFCMLMFMMLWTSFRTNDR